MKNLAQNYFPLKIVGFNLDTDAMQSFGPLATQNKRAAKLKKKIKNVEKTRSIEMSKASFGTKTCFGTKIWEGIFGKIQIF